MQKRLFLKFYPIFSLLMLLAHSALADTLSRDQLHRYPSFSYQSSQAVFPDFLKAEYSFAYDATKIVTEVTSEIDFDQAEEGYPVFDLVADPRLVQVDGMSASAPAVKTPDQATTLRIVSVMLKAGRHHLSVRSPLTRVDPAINGFFMDDSVERFFLERYVPASFEYDHVKMVFNVSFKNFSDPWKTYSNGRQSSSGTNAIKIEFPDYMTCSSIYFHAVPESFAQETKFNFNSMSGKIIPVLTYVEPTQTQLKVSPEQITTYLTQLETLYGAFPHASLTIYFGRANVDHFNDMEYSGATITTPDSIFHELAHSYFARGVMPANGNSNWIDEAIADWTERELETTSSIPARAQLASLPAYARYCWNIKEAYGMSAYLGYLNGQYQVREFLKYWAHLRFGQSVTTEEFIADMEAYLGVSLVAGFHQEVY